MTSEAQMVKWAGINLSVIPSIGKPTTSRTELHRFSMPPRSKLHELSGRPYYVNKNVDYRTPVDNLGHLLLVPTQTLTLFWPEGGEGGGGGVGGGAGNIVYCI
jgi:hypothetical protein